MREKKRSRIESCANGQPERIVGYQENKESVESMGKREYGLTNGVGECVDESVLRWFGHIQRMGNDSITKRVYMGECMGRRWSAEEVD